jgi:thioredoxin-dependent peroxiredoxin
MKKIGDKAPDFSLGDGSGNTVCLSEIIGDAVVVLYFYPKNNTPGCTREACSFRDNYQDFSDLGAEVIGISSDTGSSHADFSSRLHLPFILLSDPDGAVRKAYGVSKTFGLLPGRVTFIIDRTGIIRHVFSSQFRAQKHVDEAIRIVRSIHAKLDL